MDRCLNLEWHKLISHFVSTIFAPLTREACTKSCLTYFHIGSKCELLKYFYKDWHHTERFVIDKLMQTNMFIFCFDAYLDNKTLLLLTEMTYFRLSIFFHGGENITYIPWAKFRKVMLWTQPNKIQKWDPLRAKKTFIRRKVGHTT